MWNKWNINTLFHSCATLNIHPCYLSLYRDRLKNNLYTIYNLQHIKYKQLLRNGNRKSAKRNKALTTLWAFLSIWRQFGTLNAIPNCALTHLDLPSDSEDLSAQLRPKQLSNSRHLRVLILTVFIRGKESWQESVEELRWEMVTFGPKLQKAVSTFICGSGTGLPSSEALDSHLLVYVFLDIIQPLNLKGFWHARSQTEIYLAGMNPKRQSHI